jgi:hypothetical protein
MATPGYAELHCHSALSLLDGASLPEVLAERAAALGYIALALTDHDEMGGVVRFGTACEALELPGILGTELTVRMPELGGRGGERRTHLVLLAESRVGYRNISTLVTRARMDSERGRPSVPWALVTRHVEGVTALSGCPRGWLPQLLAEGREDEAWTAACELRDVFGTHLAVECWDHRLPEERALVKQLQPLAARLGVPWVVTNNVHYAEPSARIVHDVLLTLRHERTLDTMGTRLKPNAEWALKPIKRIYQRWRGAEDGVRATVAIAERCAFRLQQLKPSLPAFPLPPGVSANEYLARLVEQGAHERWGTGRTLKHDRQLAHELGMIRKLELAGFFLIVWDIVRFARREGILCQGRGSAANSAVCFCLGITAVDPVRMELLFERFLSEDRKEPPDIDIDFAHRDRERVLQYVYNRYGREHAAMVCEQITWRGRSAVRDAARVLGFSTEQADMLAALSDRFSARSTADALRVDGGDDGSLNGSSNNGSLNNGNGNDGSSSSGSSTGGSSGSGNEAARLGQQMIGGTEATSKARVVRESARKVASSIKPSSVPSPPSASSVLARPASVNSASTRPPALSKSDRPRPKASYEPYGSPNAQRTPKGISERDATWQQLIDLQAERKLAGDERARLGPLAKGADNARPGGRQRVKIDPSSRLPLDDEAPRPTHAEFVEGRNRTTATRDGASGRELLQRAGLDPDDPRVRQLAHVVAGLHQLPRHRSIHVGGFILTEEPLGSVVPLEPASMPDRTVIQWEKDDLDPVGLVKIDLLGLGMLTVVQDCLLYIRHTRGVTVDLGQLDMSDAAVYDVMCRADTVGLFQSRKPRADEHAAAPQAALLLRSRGGSGAHPPRPHSGRDGAPVSAPARRARARHLSAPFSVEKVLQAHPRRTALSGAGHAGGHRGRGLHPGPGRSAARAMGHKRSRERMAAICEELIAGMAAQRHSRRDRTPHLQPDQRLRRLRLSRKSCRELCAHRVRHGVAAALLRARVSLRDAQCAAHGILCARHAHRRREAPWRAGAARRSHAERMGSQPRTPRRPRARAQRRHGTLGETDDLTTSIRSCSFPPPTRSLLRPTRRPPRAWPRRTCTAQSRSRPASRPLHECGECRAARVTRQGLVAPPRRSGARSTACSRTSPPNGDGAWRCGKSWRPHEAPNCRSPHAPERPPSTHLHCRRTHRWNSPKPTSA